MPHSPHRLYPPCLQVLDLSFNRLSSSLPESWGRLGFLSTLNLRSNTLTGSLPASWAAQTLLLQLCAGGGGRGHAAVGLD
jgi:hypothetical protein